MQAQTKSILLNERNVHYKHFPMHSMSILSILKALKAHTDLAVKQRIVFIVARVEIGVGQLGGGRRMI